MSTLNNADTIWQIMPPSRGKIGNSERFLSIGQPINALEAAWLLVHRQTNTCLTADPKNSEKSEFGVEYEVYMDRTSAFGKLGLIVAEFKGVCTGTTRMYTSISVITKYILIPIDKNLHRRIVR